MAKSGCSEEHELASLNTTKCQAERSEKDAPKLKRELGLFSAINLIISVMIGSGVFVSPTKALEYSGSVGLCLIVWLLSGVISFLGALCYAELGTVVPKSGSEYAYFQEAFGKLHKFWGPLPSFLLSWVFVLVLRPAEVAIIVMTFAEYTIQPFGALIDYQYMDANYKNYATKLFSVTTLGIITYINFISVKLYVKLQNIFGIFKVVACAVVVGGGIYELIRGNTKNLSQGFVGSNLDAGNMALAMYSGLWAYDGWNAVTVITEEIINPGVNLPLSIAIAVPVITCLYVFMNVAYMTVLSVPEMMAAPAVAVEFGARALGPLSFVIPLGVALSTFSCALSVQFGVSRLCYVSAREGHMLESFSFIHIKRLTPAPAVVLQGLITFLFIVSGDITELIEMVSFILWMFYGLAMVSLLVLRRTRPDTPRPYRVPTVVPGFILLVAVFLSILPLVHDPSLKYLFAVGFILLGLVVYTVFIYYKKTPKGMGKLTYLIQVLFVCVPTHQD